MKTKITTEFPEMAYLLVFCEDKHLAPLYARLQLWQRREGLRQFFGFSEAIDVKLRIWFNDHTLAGRVVTDTASLEALLNQNAVAESIGQEIIQMLVNPKRSIFKKKVQVTTSLQTAVLFRDLEMVRALLAEGAKVDYEMLSLACFWYPGSLDIKKMNQGENLYREPCNARWTRNHFDLNGRTKEEVELYDDQAFWVITPATLGTMQKILILLIEHGDLSCMNKQNHHGETLLGWACREEHTAIVTAMLRAGAPISKSNHWYYPRVGGGEITKLHGKIFFEALMDAPSSEMESMYKRWLNATYCSEENKRRMERSIKYAVFEHLVSEKSFTNPKAHILALKYALEVDEEGKPSNPLSYLMHSSYMCSECHSINNIEATLFNMQRRIEYGSHSGAYHSRRPYLLVYGPQQSVHPHPMKNTMGDHRMESLGM